VREEWRVLHSEARLTRETVSWRTSLGYAAGRIRAEAPEPVQPEEQHTSPDHSQGGRDVTPRDDRKRNADDGAESAHQERPSG
jgi:hypothetical protein